MSAAIKYCLLLDFGQLIRFDPIPLIRYFSQVVRIQNCQIIIVIIFFVVLQVQDWICNATGKLQDKHASRQQEVVVKCATGMVEGRLDLLRDELLKDFREEDDEAGAGSFSIFNQPNAAGQAGASASSGGANSKGRRSKPLAAAKEPARPQQNVKVVAAKFKTQTVKQFTQMQVLVDKAIKVGEAMVKSVMDGCDDVKARRLGWAADHD